MGILDTALEVMQSQSIDGASPNAATSGNMIMTILGLVSNPELGGSLSGLLDKFSQKGLSKQVASWVGVGKNFPINGAQVQEVLGSSFVEGFAEKQGLSKDDAADSLASVLPQVVDKLTPDGEVSNQKWECLRCLAFFLSVNNIHTRHNQEAD